MNERDDSDLVEKLVNEPPYALDPRPEGYVVTRTIWLDGQAILRGNGVIEPLFDQKR